MPRRPPRLLALVAAVAALVLTLLAPPGATATAAPAGDHRGATAVRVAADPVVWLCRPGQRPNPCEIPTDTTDQRADGTTRTYRLPRQRPSRRPVDCFYVYPTVSNQVTPNANRAKAPEIVSIAQYQAARFSTRCRVFAPVYRQATFTGLATGPLGASRRAYADVRQAWRSYLARYNRGRGVVLIGHSQGTIMLRKLVREEIDPRPQLRRRLVGALLMGGNVTTARGRTTGGDFRHVPLCTRRGQAGCVVAYSTYATDPLVAFFGNTRTDFTAALGLGLPAGAGYEVACTDPGRLVGSSVGSRRSVGVTVPSRPFAPGPISAGIAFSVNGDVPRARTTWVRPADRFRGACRTINGAHVYRYDPVGPASRRPNEFPPTWGTHLFDVNLGLERLLRVVALQTRTWQRQQAR
ncbi:DUF3089 domain-containing protein [Nocardioides nanhaiensis]|uniref:DUF3089 domain-containing protein n=1 Tax=Nocardioides nanhaiensis TaxID=1476871 RepID=UPI0031E813EB